MTVMGDVTVIVPVGPVTTGVLSAGPVVARVTVAGLSAVRGLLSAGLAPPEPPGLGPDEEDELGSLPFAPDALSLVVWFVWFVWFWPWLALVVPLRPAAAAMTGKSAW